MAPQLAYVHALSHIAPHAGTPSSEERQQAPDKVCETCAALAHLGAALPSHFEWHAQADAFGEPAAVPLHSVARQAFTAFQARAPPSPALS
jgi:hypothetical protein